jgi:hypothetical protein
MNKAQLVYNELNKLMAPHFAPLDCLKARWDDEKEFEDFADYAAVMKNHVPAGWTFIKATKSPFGFSMKKENFIATLKITARDIRMALQETRS